MPEARSPMILVIGLWTFLRAMLVGSAAVAIENLALRHQLLVLQLSVDRPRLSRRDRIFWFWQSRVWVGWRSTLASVPRGPRSFPHPGPGPSPPTPAPLRRLSQHHAAAPIARQQQSPAPGHRTSTMWPDHRHSSGQRAPLPLPARRPITATADPPVVRSWGPTGCSPAVWRFTVASARPSPWDPSDLRSEDAAFGSRR
jgi:hypothetical protein